MCPLSVIGAFVKYGEDVLGTSKFELSTYLRRRVAVAIQRGNGRLDRLALMKSRQLLGGGGD